MSPRTRFGFFVCFFGIICTFTLLHFNIYTEFTFMELQYTIFKGISLRFGENAES